MCDIMLFIIPMGLVLMPKIALKEIFVEGKILQGLCMLLFSPILILLGILLYPIIFLYLIFHGSGH